MKLPVDTSAIAFLCALEAAAGPGVRHQAAPGG